MRKQNMSDTITDGKVVSLAYVLTVDGQEVSRTDSDDPLEYLHGAQNIIPGLEAALAGKKVGDKINVTLNPDEAYGDYDEDEVEEIDRDDMPEAEALEEGMLVEVEDEDGYTYVATVTQITDDTVTLDFNPPLAGKTLTYSVEVLGMREANEDELDHGHPHSLDHDHFDDYDDEE
jgi:FKBP-type peptidyl-prolyl cis-trans isomerase SlyD